jgi:TolB-like protein/DNA-binding winged helix-turn-helix (wHTH) protein/Tfp pilus assembly protein PilF
MTVRLRFGAFEANLTTGELRKHGVHLKLHDQPFQVLCMLVSRPDELVTREEIQQKLWPSGTFVDFENSLNSAVNRLRDALGDSADKPKFIETIPRRGYRFIAPVGVAPLAEPAGIVLQDVNRPPVLPLDSVPVSSQASERPRFLYWTVAVCVVLLTATSVSVQKYILRHRQTATSMGENRVVLAVLPITNLTGDSNQKYLADGLTEELTAELGRLDNGHLGVIARTSAMAYKGASKTAGQIGRELNAQYLLECSLREQGRRVRVSAQLIRARDQTHLWARDYERDVINVLELEDDLAADIAREVNVQLTPEQRMLRHASKAANPAAYDAYLQGRFLYSTRNKESLFRARDLFQQVIRSDPDYARGYDGLAEAYLTLGGGYMPSAEAYELGRAAAIKALQLDDALAEAHAALGYFKFIDEWDWPGAEREFRRAIELDPQDTNAQQWYALYLAAFGRGSEAIEHIGKALELDPLSISSNYNAGYIYCEIGRYDEAADQFRRALELEPTSSAAHGGLAMVYSYQHRYKDALLEYAAAQRINGTIVQFAGPGGHRLCRDAKEG